MTNISLFKNHFSMLKDNQKQFNEEKNLFKPINESYAN